MHYGLLDAGLLVTPIPLGAASLGLVGGRIADHVGFRPMLLVGSFAFAFGAIWFVTMVSREPDVSAWLVGVIAAGLNQTLQRVGAAIGIAIAVAFVVSVGL